MEKTYKEILNMAIRDEVEAFEFYDSVAQKVSDRSLKQIFGELAGEEQKHRQLLQAFLNNPSMILDSKKKLIIKYRSLLPFPIGHGDETSRCHCPGDEKGRRSYESLLRIGSCEQ